MLVLLASNATKVTNVTRGDTVLSFPKYLIFNNAC